MDSVPGAGHPAPRPPWGSNISWGVAVSVASVLVLLLVSVPVRLIVLGNDDPADSPARAAAAAGGARSGTASTGAEPVGPPGLAPPVRVGPWQIAVTPPAVREARRAQQQAQRRYAEAQVLAASYRRPGDSRALVLVGLSADPGSPLHDDLGDSPERVARTYLRAAGVPHPVAVDPGRLRGALLCGSRTTGVPGGAYVCTWADSTVIGAVSFAPDTLDGAQAAVFTRDLREFTSV